MLPEPNRKWSLVSSGNQRSYQYSPTQSSLSYLLSLSQRPPTLHCASTWTTPQRGDPYPSASQRNSKTMAVVLLKISSNHRSAPTRQTQQCGRQRVKRVLPLQGIANRPTSDPALPNKVQCRSLCLLDDSSPPW